MYTLKRDYIFKNLVSNPQSKWFMIEFVSNFLSMDKDYVAKHLSLRDTYLYKYKEKEKGRIADKIVLIDNFVLNLELNNYYYKSLFLDKLRYPNHLYNEYFPQKSLIPNKKIIQININDFNEFNSEDNGNVIVFKDTNNKVMNNHEKVIMYSLVKIKEKWYNKTTLSKLEKLLLLLKLNKKELEKFVREDEYMQELEEQNKILEQLCESMDKAFDYEEEKEREFKCILAQKEEDGIKLGKAEGIIEGKSEMVKALYEDKMPLDKIAKLAKLSQNQLKQILML